MHLEHTFDLLEIHFQSDIEGLQKLLKREEFMSVLDSDPNTMLHFTNANISEFHAKFKCLKDRVEEQIIDVYYDERINLLKLCYMFMTISTKEEDPVSDSCAQVFNKLNKNNEILKSFWEVYKSYSGDFRICKTIEDMSSKEKHSLQILKEQADILDNIMFITVKSAKEKVTQEMFLDMLFTFTSRHFMGYFYEIQNEHHVIEYHMKQQKYAEMIIDQSVLIILFIIDIKYLQNFDNNIKIHDDVDSVNLNVNRMPLSLFRTDAEKLVRFFEDNTKVSSLAPIYVTFISIFNLIREYIDKGIIKDNQLIASFEKIKGNDMMNFSDEKRNTININYSVESMNNMYDRVIFSQERISFHQFQKFVIKYWLNIIIKYYLNYSYDIPFIQLCVKTLDDELTNIMFWNVDEPYETPLAKLYDNIIADFPYNFHMLLMFSNAIKGTKSKSYFSSQIFEKLSSMQFFNVECRSNEFKIQDNRRVSLKIPKITEWGLNLQENTQGTIIRPLGDDYYQVRFDISFSLFELLYIRWVSLIETLDELSTQRNLDVEDFGQREDLNVRFISLFCSLMSENISNTGMFFDKLRSKDNNKQFYIMEDEILEDYKKLLSFSFETLSLLSKNSQLYDLLQKLANCIYRLIVSFFHNYKINGHVLTVINQNFISNFQGVTRGEFYNQNINLNIPNKHGQFTNFTYNRRSHNVINLVDIFCNTISYDTRSRNFENTVFVLKIVKHFFKYPNIFEFVKSLNSAEFLYSLWQYIVVEFVKSLFSTDNFTTREEFTLCKEIIKLISNNLRILCKSNTNKANIVLVDPTSFNILHELLINCLNLFESSDLILRILKTKVVIDNRESLLKDRISINNDLWDNFTKSGNNFYMDKIKAKNLIRVTFECLNQIFDMLLLFKTTTDDNTRKNYSRIQTIKYWDDVFFINKIIPYYQSIDHEVYSINLILSLFSYIDFEDKVLLDFVHSTKVFHRDQESEMEDGDMSDRKLMKFDDLIYYRKTDDKDYNICTLSISTINRIIVLLRLQSETSNVNIDQGLNPLQVTKSSSIVNYFYLKKENSSDLENSINLFEKYKETLCLILMKPFNYPYKIEIIKLLTQCAVFQPNFISLLFDEIKLRNLKSKKFLEIFGYLVSAKLPHQAGSDSHLHFHDMQNTRTHKQYERMMGHLTILISWIFTNDVLFKKIIKDLLSTFKSDFDKFLNKSLEIFSLTDTETKLNTTRKSYIKSPIDMNTQCKYFVFTEDDITEACFHNLVNKSLSIIFSKLIIVSEHSEKMSTCVLKFSYHKELMKFLNGNVSNFIQAYNCKINYEFLNELNFILADEKSFNNYNQKEEGEINKSRSIHSYSKYNQNYNVTENAINFKNIEKIITNNAEGYFLPFAIDHNKGVFCYSLNYWIDMKELYIEMKTRNYNTELFTEFMKNFIEHNLELSLFEAKTQTMHSISYLLGLIFSIGLGNNFMSSYLFTGQRVYDIINQSSQNKVFVEQLLAFNSNEYPKLGFNILSDISVSELIKFLDDKIIKKIELDLSFCNPSGTLDFAKRDQYSVRNSNNFNFYSQYQAYKFNIANYIFDYCIYLFNSREEKNNSNISLNVFQKHGMKILDEIEKHFPSFLNSSSIFEIEKCILSIVNLVLTVMTYLNVTDYDFSQTDIKRINSIMGSLILCYEKIPAYQAIIIYIINSYSSISRLASEDEEYTSLNILINTEDHRLIRMLLKKLSAKMSEQEYLAVITLLISLVDKYDQILEIIVKDKIMLVFQLNDKFENSLTINEYQDNERGVNHILWCWTLIFLRQVCSKLIDIENDNLKFYSIYHSIVEFIMNHEKRFMYVLCNSDYFDHSGNHIHKSLAFLEELEYMSSLINALFYQAKRWKNTSQVYLDFHNKVVSLVLSKTIKIYSPNIRIANHYKCFSNNEKNMNEIFASDAGVGIPQHKDERMEKAIKDEHFTTTFSPLKKNIRTNDNIGSVSSFSQIREPFSTSPSLHYNTMVSTMFFYRVDHVLTKVLYNLTNIVKSAVIYDNFANKNSYGYYMKEFYGSKGQAGAIKYFDEQCQNLVYALYYAIHNLDISIKNFSILENLSKKTIIFFNNINSSVNYGNLNLIYNEGKFINIILLGPFEEIFQLNNCTIQNILLINMNFYQLLTYFRKTLSYSFDTQLKEVTLKKIGLIEKIMKDRDVRAETLRDTANLNANLFEHVKRNLD